MLFACSCGSGKGSGDTTTEMITTEGTTDGTTTEAGDTTEPEDTDPPVTTTDKGEEPRPTEFSRGEISGNVYDNAFAEITFTKPDSWTFMTDAELAEQIGVALDKLNAKNPFENDEVLALIDALASDEDGNNVSISFEETNITPAAYLNSVKTQLSSLGYTFGETSTVELGGVSYTKLVASVTMEGVSMNQGLYVRTVDGLMCILTVTLTSGNDFTACEAMFS